MAHPPGHEAARTQPPPACGPQVCGNPYAGGLKHPAAPRPHHNDLKLIPPGAPIPAACHTHALQGTAAPSDARARPFVGRCVTRPTAQPVPHRESLRSATSAPEYWWPDLASNRSDRHYFRIARVVSSCASGTGLGCAFVFSRFDSISAAHGAFTSAVTPQVRTCVRDRQSPQRQRRDRGRRWRF